MFQKNDTVKRYDGLDFAKFLCAFLVISIHMSYFGKRYFEPLTRFAVPIFFMITGYFYSSIKKSNRESGQIKKTIAILLFSNLLYLLWKIARCVLLNESFSIYFSPLLSVKAWIKSLCFNWSFFSEHLWYLGALLYVLVIILIVDKYSHRKKLYKFIPLLLLANIILGNYSTLLFGVQFPLILTRNFLFCGLPFFLLGDALRQKQCALTQNQLTVMAIFAMLLTMAENIFLLKSGKSFNADCFFATPFLAYSLFVLFLENTNNISSKYILANIAKLGKSTSTTVYIVHPIAITIVGKIVNIIGEYFPYLNTMYHYVAPLIVLILCTVFAYFFNLLKEKHSHFLQKTVR